MTRNTIIVLITVLVAFAPYGALAIDLTERDKAAHAGVGATLSMTGSMLARKIDPTMSPVLAGVMGFMIAMVPLAVYEGVASEDYSNDDMAANVIGSGIGATIYITLD